MEKGENEYWGAFCQQSEPVTFISLLLDFRKPSLKEPKGIRCRGGGEGRGEVRWAQGRKGLMMADGGRHGPNEV